MTSSMPAVTDQHSPRGSLLPRGQGPARRRRDPDGSGQIRRHAGAVARVVTGVYGGRRGVCAERPRGCSGRPCPTGGVLTIRRAVSDDRQDESDRKLAESSSLAVEQKLAKALAELVAKGLGERREEGIVLRFCQLDLASLIGASREAVVPVIRALKASGIVTTGRKMLTIADLAAVDAVAQSERPA